MSLAWFQNLGMGEVLLIILVIVLLFGAKRIPELARSLGKSLTEFKKGQQEGASGSETEEKNKEEKKPDQSSP